MEMRAKESINISNDITPPLSPLAFSLYDSSLSSHCSSCFHPLSTTTAAATTTTTSPLHYCSTCTTTTTTTSLPFSSAEHHLLSLLHSHPSLYPHSSSADLRIALRLLYLHPLPPSRSLSPRFFGLLTNRDALLSDEDHFVRVRVGARVMAMAIAMRDEREFDHENGGFELEEAFLCLVITNAVEIIINGDRLGVAVYDWRFSWINHSCSPNSCFRFVPVASDMPDCSSSSSLRIFASGDAANVDVRGDCGTCELAEGVDNYGPRLIVRSIKDIKEGEEVTITYTDLLQPTALRQPELFLKYKFSCDCKRCNAVPQAYVDYALQETFCVSQYNSSNKIFDGHNLEEAVERLAVLLDSIIAEYMEVGDPISCCEKVEELFTKGLFNQHINVKLSPLHYLSLKAYTILMSTYKIRADLSIGEIHFSSFDMLRISAAYSLMLACATHHLFQSEPSLIASAATFWVDAGKSLLNLGKYPSWNSIVNDELQKNSAFNCPSCSLMNKFESSFSPTSSQSDFLDGIIQEFHKCISIITPKIWSFLVQGCKYLLGVREPIDLRWVWATRTSENGMSKPDESHLGNVGESEKLTSSVSAHESINARTNVFQLGIHCVLFGGHLWSICYSQSCSKHLVHNLLQN